MIDCCVFLYQNDSKRRAGSFRRRVATRAKSDQESRDNILSKFHIHMGTLNREMYHYILSKFHIRMGTLNQEIYHYILSKSHIRMGTLNREIYHQK